MNKNETKNIDKNGQSEWRNKNNSTIEIAQTIGTEYQKPGVRWTGKKILREKPKAEKYSHISPDRTGDDH